MSTMLTDTFITKMEAMRAHYKSGSINSYMLDTVVTFDAQAEEFPPKVKQAIDGIRNDMQDFGNIQKDAITKPTQQYVDTQNIDKFEEGIEQARTKAKEEANKRIDKYFDTMLKLGEEFPLLQSAILLAAKKISDFFSGLLNKIVSFIATLIENIVELVKEALKNIKSFFEDILNGIKIFFESIS